MVSRLHPPDQPPRGSLPADLRFEAAKLSIVVAFNRVQRQPGRVSRRTVGAPEDLAVDDNAGMNVLVNCQRDDVSRAAPGALPLLGQRDRRTG
jgi:hypothetical protein